MPILSASRQVTKETTTPADADDYDATLSAVRAATPGFAPDYPGAEFSSVGTRVDTARSFELSLRTGVKLDLGRATHAHSKTFTTRDTPEEVMRFYRAAAEADGLQVTRDTPGPDGTHIFKASSAQNHVTVDAAPQGGGALATVTYSVPAS